MKAVYKGLAPIYQTIERVRGENEILQKKLNILYRLCTEKGKEYLDNSLDQDNLSWEIDQVESELIQYEKALERKFNDWKGDHWGDPLFEKLDNSLFDIELIGD